MEKLIKQALDALAACSEKATYGTCYSDLAVARRHLYEIIDIAQGATELLGSEVAEPEPVALATYTEFREVARPLMKWLADNHHPHYCVKITSTSAVLLEEQCSLVTHEYVKD